MALGLFTGSKNIERNKGNSNAKYAITPHRRSKVMVEQIRKNEQLEAGRKSQSNSQATSSRHTSGQRR
jgi:hypothetical protein